MSALADQLRAALATASFDQLRAEEELRARTELVLELRVLVDRVEGLSGPSAGSAEVSASPLHPLVEVVSAPPIVLPDGAGVNVAEDTTPTPPLHRCEVPGCGQAFARKQSLAVHVAAHRRRGEGARPAIQIRESVAPPANSEASTDGGGPFDSGVTTDEPVEVMACRDCRVEFSHLMDLSTHTLSEHGRYPTRGEKAGRLWAEVGAVA